MGAEAVSVTPPADAPVTVKVALLWPSGMSTMAGTVTLPLPDCVRVTVKPPTSAGAAEVTVNGRLSPTRRVAVAGVRLNAGGVRTVSDVSALMEPGAAGRVIEPAARADAKPPA